MPDNVYIHLYLTMPFLKRFLHIAAINIGILLVLLIPVELIFGGWFNPNRINQLNLIRNKQIQVDVKDYYERNPSTITYTRDQFGLRGQAANTPERIDVLTVGGSTTDQRYIDDQETWQHLLEQQFKQAGTPLVFSNAGVDGHSTYGHLKSFEWWFPQIPQLKPRYILFYIGINDFNIGAGHERDRLETISLLQRSALYHVCKNLYRSFKANQFAITHRKIDLHKLEYVTQGLVMDSTRYDALTLPHRAAYAQRLELLIAAAQKMNATPIFISQPAAFYVLDTQGMVHGTAHHITYDVPINGVDFYHLQRRMDATCKQVAQQHGVMYIDAAQLTQWTKADFYDYVHLNPMGTRKLADVLYGKLQSVMTVR